MKIGLIQSSYIPWRGYFDLISSADVFVLYDDVQYTNRDWRNRNKIKTQNGSVWITVPVSYRHTSQLISDTEIVRDRNWEKKHEMTFRNNYADAPFFETSLDLISPIFDQSLITISELNRTIIAGIMQYLEITTPIVLSTDYQLSGAKTGRLIDLLIKLGADSYLSGPSADAYLDKDLFRQNGIQLEYKSYDYLPYPQLWGDFQGQVSILDLIANCGPQSKSLIKSRTPDRVVVNS